MHGTGHQTFCAIGIFRWSWKQAWWTLFSGAGGISTSSDKGGGPVSLVISSGSRSSGVLVPSGVGMKSSSGVKASDSSSADASVVVGGGERVMGGGVGGRFC